ncbi:hypothetical protein GCM10010972_26280 [Cellulomonas carbonis]|nr:hypothetical protein GCM10010972_26280 [Cellulomonas carbonis]
MSSLIGHEPRPHDGAAASDVHGVMRSGPASEVHSLVATTCGPPVVAASGWTPTLTSGTAAAGAECAVRQGLMSR